MVQSTTYSPTSDQHIYKVTFLSEDNFFLVLALPALSDMLKGPLGKAHNVVCSQWPTHLNSPEQSKMKLNTIKA